ncbi:uncharacterized protein BT62DRAFT_933180 [Guyanagaster necrorhizus]|uniref:Uncharacterized protein n=1 Tax=Guyanagaster necrorhizus TaxID=856835 RepID=A0A9P7VSQ0_9AGAR|nr:uncharacterized protein BT62DRAFT_933180 [Guyanagaster necrorhizus MCA 3950]KAG7445334.1 hypothetical protein BT62DRAFT_933180 [Guyanagaster necrorhizus MCA 3950]
MSLLSFSPRCCKFGVIIPLRTQTGLPTRYVQTDSSPTLPRKRKEPRPIPRKVVLGEAWTRRLVLFHGDLPQNQETISVFNTLTTYNPFFLLPGSKYVDPFLSKDPNFIKPDNFVLETVAFPSREDIQTVCDYTGSPFPSLAQKPTAFATHSIDAFLEQFLREPERTKMPFMVDHLQKNVIFSATKIIKWVHQEILVAGKRELVSLERLRAAFRIASRVTAGDRLQREIKFREEMWEKVYLPYEQLRKARLKMTLEKRKQK